MSSSNGDYVTKTSTQHLRKVRYEPVSIEHRNNDDPIDTEEDTFVCSSLHCKTPSWQLYTAFWTLGLMNNASYVIMLAAAKSISEGGTALVFLANIVPGLIIKGTAPYWFDLVSYKRRLQGATISMMLCFGLVATASTSLSWQLLGVAFASLQGGLGEASLLALAGKMDGVLNGLNKQHDNAVLHTLTQQRKEEEDKGRCLTCFSSGTGFAGVFGFFWKWFWNDWLQFSLSTTMWLAMGLVLGYWSTFQFVMKQQNVCVQQQILRYQVHGESPQGDRQYSTYHDDTSQDDVTRVETRRSIVDSDNDPLSLFEDSDEDDPPLATNGMEICDMTGWQRFVLVLSLWPYTIPLFTVYVAEYSLQSGTWTAIGFPVSDRKSREAFFEFSNWMYQLGVFLSRSSGTLFTVPIILLWVMPLLQAVNVGFYWFVAASQRDHDDPVGVYSPPFLYAVSLYTGLLGGAVYCHGYLRICKDLPLQYREFALSATSLAECLGIVVADVFGLFIQACLYQINGLDGAILACPSG